MPALGVAYLYSKSNKQCRAFTHDIIVGMFMEIPTILIEKIEASKELFGELPKDLEFGWHKY